MWTGVASQLAEAARDPTSRPHPHGFLDTDHFPKALFPSVTSEGLGASTLGFFGGYRGGGDKHIQVTETFAMMLEG